MRSKSLIIALLFSRFAAFALAAQAECPQHCLGGESPDFLDQARADMMRGICYKSYSLIQSGLARTPLTSTEHLIKGHLTSHHLERNS